MRYAVIADFKRSFLRASTIIVIALFALIGVGIAYATQAFIAQQTRVVGLLGYASISNSSVNVVGIVYNAWGDTVDGYMAVTLENCETRGSWLGSVTTCSVINTSRFHISKTFNVSIPVPQPNISKINSITLSVNTSYGRVYGATSTAGAMYTEIQAGGYGLYILPPLTIYSPVPLLPANVTPLGSLAKGDFIAYQVIPSGDYVKMFLVARLTDSNVLYVYYGYGEKRIKDADDLRKAVESKELTQLLITNKSVVSVYTIPRKDNKMTMVFRYGDTIACNIIDVGSANVEKVIKAPVIQAFVSQLSTAMQFLPIVMLYIAYVLIAKPRSIGALEFVLSMPITRREIYLSRFLGGSLTALAISVALVLSASTSTYLLMKIPIDASYALQLLAGMAIALIATYSFFYMLAAILRGGRYLAVAITTYIILLFVLPTIIFVLGLSQGGISKAVEYSNAIEYFKPWVAWSYVESYVVSQVAEGAAMLDPVKAVASSVAWLVIPHVIGWLVFRRADLGR